MGANYSNKEYTDAGAVIINDKETVFKSEIILKIGSANSQDFTTENIKKADVAIEFSTPANAFSNVKKCLENKFSNVEVIIAKQNLGYGKGNNLGISRVNTQYAFILNPDAILEENCLEELYKAQLLLKDDFVILAPNLLNNYGYFSKKNNNFKHSYYFYKYFFIILFLLSRCLNKSDQSSSKK